MKKSIWYNLEYNCLGELYRTDTQGFNTFIVDKSAWKAKDINFLMGWILIGYL